MQGDLILKFVQILSISALLPLSGCFEYFGTGGPDHCGAVEGREVWSKASNPHIISCNTTISGEVIVGPGTRILFTEGAQLIVTGGLSVEGTADEPVHFEPKDGASFPGLIVRGNEKDTILSHAVFQGGGYSEDARLGGITIDSGPVELNEVSIFDAFSCGILLTESGRIAASSGNVTVKRSGGYPLCGHVQGVESFDESMFTLAENEQEGTLVFGEELQGLHVWDMSSWTYIIEETFRVSSGELRLEPGVALEVAAYHSVVIGRDEEKPSGRFIANGTAEAPVRISGSSDQRGVWGGLFVEESAGTNGVRLTHTRIENGASINGFPEGMLTTGPNVEVFAQNLTISGAETNGFSFGLGSGFTSDSQDISVVNGGQPGVITADGVGRLPDTLTISDHDTNEIRVTSSEVLRSATWRAFGPDYVLERGLRTENGSVDPLELDFEAGVSLRFAEGTEMELGESGTASVQFLGTAEAPITLSSYDNEDYGAWGGIQFSGGLSQALMRHVSVSGGGEPDSAALRLDGVAVEVDTVSVSGSAGAGFRLRGAGFSEDSEGLIVSGNVKSGLSALKYAGTVPVTKSTFVGNDVDAIELTDVNMVENVAIPGADVPFTTTRNVLIAGSEEDPQTITLQAGATLNFGVGRQLEVRANGAVVAEGTPEAPVQFGPIGEAVPGTWTGIVLNGNADARTVLSHIDVGYAGGTSAQGAAILVKNGDPVIRDSNIHDSSCYGVYVKAAGSSAIVENNTYSDNGCADVVAEDQ